jgi:hypothetical protein
MRRRFAGQAIEGSGANPSDTLATVTEALKIALKSSRGGRLGAGTEEERVEGASAVPAIATGQPTVASPAAAAAPAMDIAKLRSALGIDELMSSLKTAGTQTETPEFKMPEFEMPQFEAPDWQSMMPDFESLIKQYMPQQNTESTSENTTAGDQTTGTQPVAASQKPVGTKVNVGGKTYNLSRAGGVGLGGQDIKNMQKLGFTKSQISKAAAQATTAGARISTGAKNLLGKMQPAKKQPSTQAKSTAKNITGSARQAIARTAARPAAKPAASKASRGKK